MSYCLKKIFSGYHQMTGKKFFILLLLCGGSILLLLIHMYGYERVFSALGVKAMSPSFLDLRSITSGSECHALGLDPLYENPCDPFARPLNYPRIWHLLFLLHIDQSDTVCFGTLILALFALSLPFFPDTMDRTTAVLLALCVYSPAVLLGVERGNVDLLIFALLSMSLYFSRRSPTVASGLIFTGTLLKLFPLVGICSLLNAGRRHFFPLATIVLFLSLTYFLFSLEDLIQIRKATPKGIRLAYGVDVLPMALGTVFSVSVPVLSAVSRFLLALVVVWSLLTTPWNNQPPEDSHDNRINGFWMGAAIYIATFFLGNNYNYRLVFLLFTIPQLVQWCRFPDISITFRARVALGVILFSLWSQFFARFPDQHYMARLIFGLDELANWAAFGLLLQLGGYSFPQWTKDTITDLVKNDTKPTAYFGLKYQI